MSITVNCYDDLEDERQNFEQYNFGIADISNLKINELQIRNGRTYESHYNTNRCGISNGRTVQKFANFWNFDNFSNQNENLNSKNF